MAWKVGTPKLSGKKLVQVLNTTGQYEKYTQRQMFKLKRYAIEIFENLKVDGPWRPSSTSPPVYAEVFRVRKVGLNYRLVNHDPGANWVEWGAKAGGVTPILKYKPMRRALDRLEAEEG